MKYFKLLFLCSLGFSFNVLSAQQSVQKKQNTQGVSSISNQSNDKQTTKAVIQETVLGMNVSGNKELPNVLYIVPWKEDGGVSIEPQGVRLVNEIYAPVDPDTFAKKVLFFNQLSNIQTPNK